MDAYSYSAPIIFELILWCKNMFLYYKNLSSKFLLYYSMFSFPLLAWFKFKFKFKFKLFLFPLALLLPNYYYKVLLLLYCYNYKILPLNVSLLSLPFTIRDLLFSSPPLLNPNLTSSSPNNSLSTLKFILY